MTVFLVVSSVFLLSCILTWAVHRYALARGVLDVPNSRSSHRVPTPRGGGLAIAAAFLLGTLAVAAMGRLDWTVASAVIVAGAITAAVGFWDDHAALSARSRLAAHFLAAVTALAALGGMAPFPIFGVVTLSGWPAQVFGAFMVVWLLNLYNFMDGIDGIAGAEAVTVSLSGAVIGVLAGYPQGSLACLLLAAASAGFLVWNFPPAKIFMGDVGSGFLGATFGVLVVDAARVSPSLFWSWLILLGAFIVDATVTLLRRLARSERVYEAHRSHAYQHAARAWGAHRPVTLAFAAVNVLWLLPMAAIAATGVLPGELALVIAWLPLVVLAIRYRAGVPEPAAN